MLDDVGILHGTLQGCPRRILRRVTIPAKYSNMPVSYSVSCSLGNGRESAGGQQDLFYPAIYNYGVMFQRCWIA